MTGITLAPMLPAHLPGAVALSQAAGWPHRLADWQLALGLGRGVVALRDGVVVGTACATPFGEVATLNLIIVAEALRGRGLGARLVQAAMARAAPRQWRLVATAAGAPLYRKLGFCAAGGITQLQGVPVATAGPVPELAGPQEATALAVLDRAATGADRAALVAALLARGQVAVARECGRIAAYAARREFGRGLLIGPVVAPSAELAKALIEGLLAGQAGRHLRIDIPDSAGLADWLTARGLARTDTGIEMVLGEIPQPAGGALRFALASQAFG